MVTQVTLGSGVVDSAGSLVLRTNGTTSAATFDTAQNMGLGVTPSAWYSSYKALQVKTSSLAAWGNNEVYLMSNAYGDTSSTYKYLATGSKATSYVQYEGTHIWQTAGTGTAGNAITFTQAMTLDASGNLLVGSTSNSGYKANISATTNHLGLYDTDVANLVHVFSGNGNASLYVGVDENNVGASSAFILGVDGTERMRIDSSGNLLVGKTSAGNGNIGFQVDATGVSGFTNSASTAGTNTLQVYSTGAAAYRFYVGLEGKVYCTNTTISAISDVRFKENIRDLDAGLAEVMALKPRLYDWKEGKGVDIKNARGFIAQEFEQVFPDLIDEWQDPAPEGEEPYKSVRQDLIPVLVKAIQEQQAIITSLTARIEALEA